MRGKILAGTGIGLVFLMSAGLYFMPEEEIAPREKRITFVAPIANSGYWGRAAMGILEEAKELDVDVKCIGFSELDQDKQITYLKSAIWSQADGIITAGMENTPEFSQVVEQAREAGIPVILIDSDVKDSGRNCYVGTDNYEAGRMAGEDMVRACGQEGKVAVIVSYLDNINQMQRVEGFQDVLAEYPGMEVVQIVEGQSNEIFLQDKLMRVMEETPDLKGVFCAEGYATRCMCRFLEDSPGDYGDLQVVVFDITSDLESILAEGKIYSAIQQDSRQMGAQAVKFLIRAMDGERELTDFHTDLISIGREQAEQVEKYSNTDGDVAWHIY